MEHLWVSGVQLVNSFSFQRIRCYLHMSECTRYLTKIRSSRIFMIILTAFGWVLADTLSSCLRRCSSMTWRISSCPQTLLCQGRGEDWIPMEELLIEEHSALDLQKLKKYVSNSVGKYTIPTLQHIKEKLCRE